MLVNPRFFESVFNASTDKAQGCKNVIATLREGLDKGTFKPDQISLKGIGLALGLLDHYDLEGSFEKLCHSFSTLDPHKVREESLYTESNPGLLTNAFQVATGELLSRMVIEGYNSVGNFIGDELVTTVQSPRRNQKIHGFTALGGPLEVAEGHPYSETDFAEKWVSTKETKKGRIVSLSEELILFDNTASMRLLALDLGFWVRQERERTIVRGVIDADSGAGKYVYRPSGVGEALYNADGSNKNYIGVGNTTDTDFNTAVALADWTDIDSVLQYRATKIKDDRIDGTPRPIAGLNGPQNILLVPFKKRATAAYIAGQTRGERSTNSGADITHFDRSPVADFIGSVKASEFIDEVNGDDYYYGDFKRQFIWNEIWPLQTFVQGRDSEAAFERDTALRVKTRYFGGLSARDTVLCTKIDGA